MQFKKFKKIPHWDEANMSITQKIHGTNAQVYIYEEDGEMKLACAARNRWIFPENDHYGFAAFVYANKDEFIEKLGPGRHYGEWAGPGINSGEGLKERMLFLFNWRKFEDKQLPTRVSVVPVLFYGLFSKELISAVFEDLKENGSLVCDGFMRPEGIVIEIDGKLYKKVFDNQEVAWKKVKNKIYAPKKTVDASHLLQPMRLEKLLSSDEAYIRDYPRSLSSICKDYVKDLEEENQIEGTEEEVAAIKKALGKKLYPFVKEFFHDVLGIGQNN